MHTLQDVKQELLEALHRVDKSKLSMLDLKTYSEIVKIMDEIERSNQPDKWVELMSRIGTGFGPSYKPVEMKEGD